MVSHGATFYFGVRGSNEASDHGYMKFADAIDSAMSLQMSVHRLLVVVAMRAKAPPHHQVLDP